MRRSPSLGVPVSEALGVLDEGPVPARGAVCSLGGNCSPSCPLLAVWIYLPYGLPHRCTTELCTPEQRETHTHIKSATHHETHKYSHILNRILAHSQDIKHMWWWLFSVLLYLTQSHTLESSVKDTLMFKRLVSVRLRFFLILLFSKDNTLIKSHRKDFYIVTKYLYLFIYL